MRQVGGAGRIDGLARKVGYSKSLGDALFDLP
jgi:hypothetical protein